MKKQTGLASHEVFVKAWQASKSYAEVMQKTGMTQMQVRARAQYLRLKGVKLKIMDWGRGRTPVDAAAMNKLIGGVK